MFRFRKQWLVRTGVIAGLALAALAFQPNQARAQSSSFSYYNPRTGMQYSQGYSFQGRNFTNYSSYGPPRNYGYGYGNRGGYNYAPRYTAPSYGRQSYGYRPGYSSQHCR